jgi:hypothetical protein
MASKVTDSSVQEAALTYLAEHYPGLAAPQMSVLRMERAWLVESRFTSSVNPEPTIKVVLMINRYGFVEEVGGSSFSRQEAHRCLAGFQIVSGAQVEG